MDKEQRLKLLQCYLANCAIGPTTLRNQGPKGITDAARTFLARLRLRALMKKRDTEYSDWLNKKTKELMKKFPRGAQENWGAARKAINLFMVGAYFNKVVSYQYNLHRFNTTAQIRLKKKR